MKLRISGNHIRLRLGRSEVEQLGNGQRIAETITFAPDNTLTYSLKVDPDERSIIADYRHGQLAIRVPEAMARAWAGSDAVGMSAHHPPAGGPHAITIEIEKDFPCGHRADEDPADKFADLASNPEE